MKVATAALVACAMAGQVQAGEQKPRLTDREVEVARFGARLARAAANECFSEVSYALLANDAKRRGLSDDAVRELLLDPNKPPIRRREVELGLAVYSPADRRYREHFVECLERSWTVEEGIAELR